MQTSFDRVSAFWSEYIIQAVHQEPLNDYADADGNKVWNLHLEHQQNLSQNSWVCEQVRHQIFAHKASSRFVSFPLFAQPISR